MTGFMVIPAGNCDEVADECFAKWGLFEELFMEKVKIGPIIIGLFLWWITNCRRI